MLKSSKDLENFDAHSIHQWGPYRLVFSSPNVPIQFTRDTFWIFFFWCSAGFSGRAAHGRSIWLSGVSRKGFLSLALWWGGECSTITTTTTRLTAEATLLDKTNVHLKCRVHEYRTQNRGTRWRILPVSVRARERGVVSTTAKVQRCSVAWTIDFAPQRYLFLWQQRLENTNNNRKTTEEDFKLKGKSD